MKNGSAAFLLFLTAVCTVCALALRLTALLKPAPLPNVLFAVAVTAGAALIIYRGRCRGDNRETPAARSRFSERAAEVAAAGFFFRFVSQSVLFFRGVSGGRSEAYFLAAIAVGAVLSLLSCVYFLAVALSRSAKNYDVKKLTYFHLVPLFWSLSEIFIMIAGAGEFDRDSGSLLKYALLILLTLFFFGYVRAVDMGVRNRRHRLTAELCAYTAMMYFADRLLLLIAGRTTLSDPDHQLALTGVLIAAFILSYQNNNQ